MLRRFVEHCSATCLSITEAVPHALGLPGGRPWTVGFAALSSIVGGLDGAGATASHNVRKADERRQELDGRMLVRVRPLPSIGRSSESFLLPLRELSPCDRCASPQVLRGFCDIGDSVLMISEAGPRKPIPAFLY